MRPPAAGPPATVSVVIPTYDRVAALDRCLAALGAQTRPADELIVAVQRRDAASLRFLTSRDVRVVVVDEHLQTYAMDAAVAAASGDVVALTDDDAVPAPRWLAGLLAHYADPRVGAAGGRDVVHEPGIDHSPAARVGEVRWFGRVVGEHHRGAGPPREVDFLKGVSLSLRRPLWGIDHELVGWGNQPHWELGVCLRVRADGWRVVYDPGVVVDHHPEARVREPQRRDATEWSVRRDAHNELLALRRWLPPGRRPPAIAYALAVGNRGAPGPALGALALARGGEPRATGRRVAAATGGGLVALGAGPRR